jgi:hypothetical protein
LTQPEPRFRLRPLVLAHAAPEPSLIDIVRNITVVDRAPLGETSLSGRALDRVRAPSPRSARGG